MVPKPKSTSIQTSFFFFYYSSIFQGCKFIFKRYLITCQIHLIFSDLFSPLHSALKKTSFMSILFLPKLLQKAYPQISLVLESFHPIHSVLLSEHHS